MPFPNVLCSFQVSIPVKIILVYPIPEVGFEPAKEILKMYIDNPNKYM